MTFYPQIRDCLVTAAIPFWDRLKDEQNGGFYGRVTYDLDVIKDAPKGGIATARMLWFYSAVYRVMGLEPAKENAGHLYRFLRDCLIDRDHGGIYWMADHRGAPLDTRKHVYAQAFAIYGLSEYHRATGNAVADTGLDDTGYLWNEWVKGKLDRTMVWWPQAEAMVGFLNLYQMTSDTRFLEIIERLWGCVTATLIDPRPGGEWYWSISPDGVPIHEDIVMPWKTAYHNGRFYMVFIERMGL